VLQQMERWIDKPLGSWWLSPAGSIVTSVREFRTLERLHNVPLLDYILKPTKHASVTSTRSSRSSADAAQQQPDATAAAAAAKELPAEVGSSMFRSYLNEHFDGPQIHAITCAAAHLVRQQTTPEQQQDEQMSEDEDDRAAAAAADGGEPYVPFTLIQGPPGTGKTHTVLGVLNTWHLTQFQRFFLSLDSAVRALAEGGAKLGECRYPHSL
jgi:senataxin